MFGKKVVAFCAAVVFMVSLSTGAYGAPLVSGSNLASNALGSTTAGGNGVSSRPEITPDGTKVVFQSQARNLTATDPGYGHFQIYLHDLVTGETTLISHTFDDKEIGGDAPSQTPQITSDGSKIVFASEATNLMALSPGGQSQIYVYDVALGEIILVSHVFEDPQTGGSGYSSGPSISSDGNFVAYVSNSRDMTDGELSSLGNQVYLYDMVKNEATLISHIYGNENQGGARQSYLPYLNGDGSLVVFSSMSNDLTAVPSGTSSNSQVFLYTVADKSIKLITHAAGNPTLEANHNSTTAKITPDGSKIVLQSAASNLSAGDPNNGAGTTNIYLYQVDNGNMRLISHAQGNPGVGAGAGAHDSTEPSITPDGTYIAFASRARNLTAVDPGLATNVYLYNVSTSSARLISHRQGARNTGGNGASTSTSLTANASMVAFQSIATDLMAGYSGSGMQSWVYLLAPTTTITPANGAVVNNGQISFSTVDPDGLSTTTYYRVNGGAQQTYNDSARPTLPEGVHTVTYWSVNSNGATEIAKTATITVDLTAPITITTLEDGHYYNSDTTLTLSATDPLSNGVSTGVATTHYTVNGGATQTYNEVAPPVFTAEGAYTIAYWSTDRAGNVESRPENVVTFTIDKTAPVTVTSPAEGAYTEAIEVLLAATDPLSGGVASGVEATYYRINGGGAQRYTATISLVENGAYTIEFWSIDRAGNTEPMQTVAYTIDIDDSSGGGNGDGGNGGNGNGGNGSGSSGGGGDTVGAKVPDTSTTVKVGDSTRFAPSLSLLVAAVGMIVLALNKKNGIAEL